MSMKIEEGIHQMILEGKSKLSIYWIENISDGDVRWWIDVCEDYLGSICELNWVWDVISKAWIESNDDYQESDYGTLGDWIIIDEPFSDVIVENAIREWLKSRELNIDVEIIGLDGTMAIQRILNSINM